MMGRKLLEGHRSGPDSRHCRQISTCYVRTRPKRQQRTETRRTESANPGQSALCAGGGSGWGSSACGRCGCGRQGSQAGYKCPVSRFATARSSGWEDCRRREEMACSLTAAHRLWCATRVVFVALPSAAQTLRRGALQPIRFRRARRWWGWQGRLFCKRTFYSMALGTANTSAACWVVAVPGQVDGCRGAG